MRFEYLEPTTIEEAISLLTKHGGNAKVIAGGTDILLQIRGKQIRPQYVVDITSIPGLDCINYDEEHGLRLGALTTIRTLQRSAELREKYPIIPEAASQMASVAIRNMATLGGNLCNAAPSADTAPPLIGLSARAKIIGPNGERVVPLEDFFTGPGSTVLEQTELLTEIQVPIPVLGTKGKYFKHTIRGNDMAIVGVAVVVVMSPEDRVYQDIKITLGAVAPTPLRAYEAENIIRGKQINESLINRSAQAASDGINPRPGVRASTWYKKEMVKVFTQQALTELAG
ncbi:Carbon monoxide dehydrogenase medium chain [subsurface metagenome]